MDGGVGLLQRLQPRRVAIFRALQLGDMLCAVPALRALRAALPAASITLAGLPWAEEFARRYSHYVDRFLPFPGIEGLPEGSRPAEWPRFREEMRRKRFDLVIQMHGDGRRSNRVVAELGGVYSAGFHPVDEECSAIEAFLPYCEEGPEIRRNLRLAAFLGAPPLGEAIDFPLREEEEGEAARWLEHAGLAHGSFAVVHPGGRAPARRWPIARFAQVADALAERGLRVVITGAEWEKGLVERMAVETRSPVLDTAGQLSLGGCGALLRRARLLVSNDTGISHVAAALRVPSVVVFTGSDPDRWAPLDREHHRILAHPVPCRPCSFHDCPIGHPCAEGVSVEAVMTEVDRLLGRGPTPPSVPIARP